MRARREGATQKRQARRSRANGKPKHARTGGKQKNARTGGWVRALESFAKKHLTDSSHDFGHTERVLSLVRAMGQEEGADGEVLTAAALLHDVGYATDEERHERVGARMARRALAQTAFPKEKVPAVRACIERHRFSRAHPAETIEQKILQDADKLDAMGAAGIARCFLWTGERKLPMKAALEHFPQKLLKLAGMMNTRAGKRRARARHSYMEAFLRRLEQE